MELIADCGCENFTLLKTLSNILSKNCIDASNKNAKNSSTICKLSVPNCDFKLIDLILKYIDDQ